MVVCKDFHICMDVKQLWKRVSDTRLAAVLSCPDKTLTSMKSHFTHDLVEEISI